MAVKTTCKELIGKKYTFVSDPERLRARFEQHHLNFCLAIATLDIYINAEYIDSDNRWAFIVKVKWCNGDENETFTTFAYSEEGLNNAYKWIDEERVKFANLLLA